MIVSLVLDGLQHTNVIIINYFKGKGYYARYQDLSAAPNIFDTRQSFLLKMHDTSAREKFLKKYRIFE